MAADEWPSTVWSCLTLAPPLISAEAVKCRRSWVAKLTPTVRLAAAQAAFHCC
jgi:hypothetical protein